MCICERYMKAKRLRLKALYTQDDPLVYGESYRAIGYFLSDSHLAQISIPRPLRGKILKDQIFCSETFIYQQLFMNVRVRTNHVIILLLIIMMLVR